MAQKGINNQKKGSSRKVGRNKRKALRKSSPFSAYVRGKITFEQYAKRKSV
jgi:hypothetical protein